MSPEGTAARGGAASEDRPYAPAKTILLGTPVRAEQRVEFAIKRRRFFQAFWIELGSEKRELLSAGG